MGLVIAGSLSLAAVGWLCACAVLVVLVCGGCGLLFGFGLRALVVGVVY